MLLRTAGSFLSFFLLFQSAAAYESSSDPRLLQLVPPESQIVAGMRGQSIPERLGSLLLVTRSNELDHKDFIALTGRDVSRVIHEVVFAAAADADGNLTEHSLLVSGHFDRGVLFRSAIDGGTIVESYRGVAVLAISPLARERESFKEMRWLAMPEEHIAIFGSVASVKKELDRWIARTPADPVILDRLSSLDPRDETWCLLPAPRPEGLIAQTFAKLDSKLRALAEDGGSIQYGIHFGREIEITASNNPPIGTSRNRSFDSPSTESMAVSSFLSESSETAAPRTVRIKIHRKLYESWLGDFMGGGAFIDRQPFKQPPAR